MVEYPTRCRIIDADGENWHGIEMATPDVSKPHLGKEGLAELIEGGDRVKITLEDGTVLYGEDCWWVSLPGRS